MKKCNYKFVIKRNFIKQNYIHCKAFCCYHFTSQRDPFIFMI